ncbi:MAG: rhodanese-like domain-containing protein [Candidatus Velthaea sp.]
MTEITVADLKKKRDSAGDFVLLDVREPDEIATAAIPGATLIPMMDIPQRIAELPKDKEIVVMCHHGARSAQVTEFLNSSGYPGAVNLAGGINAWSTEIDASIPRY